MRLLIGTNEKGGSAQSVNVAPGVGKVRIQKTVILKHWYITVDHCDQVIYETWG